MITAFPHLSANLLKEVGHKLRILLGQYFGQYSKVVTKSLVKIVATVVANLFVAWVAVLSFYNKAIITTMNLLQAFIFGESPRVSIGTYYNGPVRKKKGSY